MYVDIVISNVFNLNEHFFLSISFLFIFFLIVDINCVIFIL